LHTPSLGCFEGVEKFLPPKDESLDSNSKNTLLDQSFHSFLEMEGMFMGNLFEANPSHVPKTS
jgi:hypothetical protein